MAFQNTFKVKQDSTAETLTIEDISGLYDNLTNTSGLGTPNIDVSDITAVTVTITAPDAVDYVFTLATATAVALPSSNLAYFDILEVQADDLGGTSGDQLTDGTYEVTVKYEAVALSGGYVDQKAEHYLHVATSRCVYGMFSDLNVADCACDTDTVDKALYAWGLHIALQDAVQCSQRERITEIQTALNKICSNTTDCTSC